jgi:hypothetical protein
MTEHLPECWAKHESDPPAWCICDELWACADRVTALATPETVAQATYWYEQGQRDVFALHTEWTVAGMCKPDCLPCQRLTELITEREKGYEEGQRDAIADALQRVEAVEVPYSLPLGAPVGVVIDQMRREFIAAIKGDQP